LPNPCGNLPNPLRELEAQVQEQEQEQYRALKERGSKSDRNSPTRRRNYEDPN